jgi:hypothetical protein
VHYPVLRIPDIHGIVLHPTGLGEYLLELFLGHSHHISGVVKYNSPGAGGALIQGQDVLFTRIVHNIK